MKLIILVGALLFSVKAIGATDTTATHKAAPEPPVRYFYQDGSPIPPQDIQLIHEMDINPDGWKYDHIEWRKMLNGKPELPEYFFDPIHGSNGGIDFC